jgi:hypothetical protein
MILLDDAERLLRHLIRLRDEDAAVALFFRVVHERTEAMHQRAQTAESHAHKVKRDMDRLAMGK